MTDQPLLTLTPTQLQPLRGERRQQLISYLAAWDEQATLLRYLEVWLGAQPNLATLRQAHAETLLALGQPKSTLEILEALDAERGMSGGRRQLRATALAALGEADAALELLADDAASAETHLERAAVFVAARRWDEAAAAYRAAGLSLDGPAPAWRAVELAAAQADWPRAHRLLADWQSLRTEPLAPAQLRLAAQIAAGAADAAAAERYAELLRAAEQAHRDRVLAALGLDDTVDAADAPLIAEPASIAEAAPAAVPDVAREFLRTHWGYDDFRGRQAAVVAHMLAGDNTLAVLPTGAGKSLTYQLPAFVLPGATVVVSPLIALMKDQLDGLPSTLRAQATAINSKLRPEEVVNIIAEMRAGAFKLVYVAPERLRQQTFVQALREAGVCRFVVDEAHCVSLWGLSFRPDYLFLQRVIADLDHPPVLAVTATATPEAQLEIAGQFGQLHVVQASIFRPNLHFSVVEVGNNEAKVEALIATCQRSTGAVVVYARAREQCERLAATLRQHGVQAAHYHAQVEDRHLVQEQFMRGDVRVLVATIAFGMGVDKADVRMIVHFNLPQSVEAYYQEAGRAGRDGEPAECVLLYTSGDKGQLTNWLRQDALTRDDLRELYKLLRGQSQAGFVAMHPEDLGRPLPQFNETQLRVMLGMLERVGLLVRHFDLPRTMAVTLLDVGDDLELLRFAQCTRARAGQRVSLAPLTTAEACGWRPDELERRLLGWQADGRLRYHGIPTDLLLELLPPPADTAARIDKMIADYKIRQEARIAAMVGYAKGLNCRHRALAAHFKEQLPACGGPCDICSNTHITLELEAPGEWLKPAKPVVYGPIVTEMILRTVRDLRFGVGRTGLAHILTGSKKAAGMSDRCRDWGKLAGHSLRAVVAVIDDVIEKGWLVRSADDERPLLELTEQGRAALQSPATLPDLAPAPADVAPDDQLYQALERWRSHVARSRGVQTYIICANTTLRDIAADRPRTLLTLGRIKGVGPKTLEQYGAAILDVIATHH